MPVRDGRTIHLLRSLPNSARTWPRGRGRSECRRWPAVRRWLPGGEGFPIRSVGRHGRIGIGNRENPGEQRDFDVGQTIRVPCAVEAFVVGDHGCLDLSEVGGGAQ